MLKCTTCFGMLAIVVFMHALELRADVIYLRQLGGILPEHGFLAWCAGEANTFAPAPMGPQRTPELLIAFPKDPRKDYVPNKTCFFIEDGALFDCAKKTNLDPKSFCKVYEVAQDKAPPSWIDEYPGKWIAWGIPTTILAATIYFRLIR